MAELVSMFQIDSGHPRWHFVALAAIVYLFLLGALRLLGNRPMAQMNKFDVILLMVLANAVQNAMNAGDNSVLAGILLAMTLMALKPWDRSFPTKFSLGRNTRFWPGAACR